MGDTGVTVRVLGSVQVVHANNDVVDPGSPTQRRILGVLAVAAGRSVRAESLTEITSLSSSALRVSISRLRRLLGPDAIVSVPGGYRLDVTTDARRTADALAAAGHDLAALDAALAPWNGEVLTEFAHEPWAAADVARFGEMHAGAIEDRADALIEAGGGGVAVALLRAHIAVQPWRDRPRGLLMRALASSGRTREALESYQEYRTFLRDESGIEPSAGLRDIDRRIVGGWDGIGTAAPAPPPENAATAQPSTTVVPDPVDPLMSSSSHLVGREAELSTLDTALATVMQKATLGAAVLVGEAGIGKTALLQAFSDDAGSTALVLTGRCDEVVSVPLQPFRTIVDQVVTAADDEMIRAHTAAHGQILALVARSFALRAGSYVPSGGDELTDRFLMFEAVADLLARVASRQPLVVLLDDLHWAEPTALQLLRHLVRAAPKAPILLVIGTREPDEATSADLRSALADLGRSSAKRIDLSGLDRTQLAELVRSISGKATAVHTDVIDALDSDTAGNPLFATHLVQHWLETGRVDVTGPTITLGLSPDETVSTVSSTLRDIVLSRLRSLAPDAPSILAAAVLLGGDIVEEQLANVTGATPAVVSAVVDAGARAGILVDRHGTTRFAHALVAQVVESDLPSPRRRRLHERAARLLEGTGTRSTAALTRIAYHWELAGSPADALRAAVDAGDAAMLSLTADEAVHWYRRAVQHGDALGVGDAERAALLVRLGKGLQRIADPSAVDTLMLGAELAHRSGDHDTLVQAAEATGRSFIRLGDFSPTFLSLLDRALAVTPLDDEATRARLLAMLANALASTGDDVRRERAALDALALIDSSTDPLLAARLAPDILRACWSPRTSPRCADVSARAVAAVDAGGDPHLRFVVHAAAFNTAVRLADAGRATASFLALHDLVNMHSEPRMRWTLGLVDTFTATMAGRFAEAERCANETVELGMAIGEPDAFSVFGSQFFVIGTFAGRYGEILPLIDQVLASGESATPFRLAHAIACAVSGRRDEASAVLEAGRADGFDSVPADFLWLTSIVGYAVLAIELEDQDAADALLRMLEPYAGQVAFNGATSQGPVDAYLGRLASLVGRYDDADRYLRDALATAEAFGWEYHRASTLVCLAASRIRRSGGDVDGGTERLLDEAADACGRHGIQWWAARIDQLRASTG